MEMDGIDNGVEKKVSNGCIDLCVGEAVADLTGHIHQLPCCIKYDGPSSVSHYFKPKHTGIEIEGLKVEEAYFRGRKLQGTSIHLPEGYSGFVLGKRNSEGNVNKWETSAKFQAMTFWKHDNLPSQDDAYVRSFHWLAVSKAIIQQKKRRRGTDMNQAYFVLKVEIGKLSFNQGKGFPCCLGNPLILTP